MATAIASALIRIPIRQDRDGRLPVDGTDAANDWRGFIPFDELPQSLNPSSCQFVNANNSVVDADYQYLLTTDWAEPYRAERIEAVLAARKTFSLDDMVALQNDIVSTAAQSLMPLLNMRFVYPTMLIDVNRLDGIGSIEPRDDRLVIGAMVRQGDAERSPVVDTGAPLLAAALPHVGHFVTRNRGTVGGSVVHADSRSEIPVVMAALGGAAAVVSTSGKRTSLTARVRSMSSEKLN